MASRRHALLEEQLDIHTPEHIEFAFDIAGLGSRAVAYLIDLLIRIFATTLIIFALEQLAHIERFFDGTRIAPYGGIIMILLYVFMLWVYYPLFEWLWEGQTPGKRLTRLRVIRDDGTPIGALEAVLRNALRVVDFLPGVYTVGGLTMLLNRRSKRLGDYVAGTIVVKEVPLSIERYLDASSSTADAIAAAIVRGARSPHPPILAAEEYELVTRFLDRRKELEPDLRRRIAQSVAEPLRRKPEARSLLDANQSDEDLLVTLADRGVKQVAPTSLDRFIETHRSQWEALSERLDRIGDQGLKDLSHAELADLGRAYRRITADHALARTYFPQAAIAEYLNRLVARAHNRIYRRPGATWRTLLDFYLVEVPATFRRYRRYFAIALLAFVGPAVAMFGLVLVDSSFSSLFVSGYLMDHIERGEMWTDDLWSPATHDPGSIAGQVLENMPTAVNILVNNIIVTFMTFSAGVLFGVGTLWYVALNGAMLGAVAALTWQHGMARDFWSFVTPHGVVEISMILIGAMGGLIIGNCLLAPGEYSRMDALRIHGRSAARLALACVPVLFLCGWVEGNFSPAPFPFWLKQAFGLLFGAVLYAYLLTGGMRREVEWTPPGATTASPGPLPPSTGLPSPSTNYLIPH